MDTPPFVTASPLGTDRQVAGLLGQDSTVIVYGGDKLFDTSRSGGRFLFGTWRDCCQWIGFETEILALEEKQAQFDSEMAGKKAGFEWPY